MFTRPMPGSLTSRSCTVCSGMALSGFLMRGSYVFHDLGAAMGWALAGGTS